MVAIPALLTRPGSTVALGHDNARLLPHPLRGTALLERVHALEHLVAPEADVHAHSVIARIRTVDAALHRCPRLRSHLTALVDRCPRRRHDFAVGDHPGDEPPALRLLGRKRAS